MQENFSTQPPNLTIRPEFLDKYSPIINITNLNDPDSCYCSICLEGTCYENDEIVLCDLCQNAVHQSCYGDELTRNIPQEEWYCQRCVHLLKTKLEPYDIKCFLCPDITGIIKKVSINKWAHVECVNWTPEIYFMDNKNNTANIKDINPERKTELTCFICRIRYGYCLQCDYGDCMESFHTRCAMSQGTIIQMNEMIRYKISEHFLPLFCKTHFEEVNRRMSLDKEKSKGEKEEDKSNQSEKNSTRKLSQLIKQGVSVNNKLLNKIRSQQLKGTKEFFHLENQLKCFK